MNYNIQKITNWKISGKKKELVKTFKGGKYLQYNFVLKKITLDLKRICFLWKNDFTRVQCFFFHPNRWKISPEFLSMWKISFEIFNKWKISSSFLTSEKFYLIFQLVQSTILACKFMMWSDLGKVALFFHMKVVLFKSGLRADDPKNWIISGTT